MAKNSPGASSPAHSFLPVTIEAIPSRKITERTAQRYSYGFAKYRGDWVHVAQYFNNAGTLVGQKIRTRDKKFFWIGRPAGLFGEWKHRHGGRMLVLTEGELDCQAADQAQGNKYACASVPDGAGSAPAAVAKSLAWLESFDRVVLMFDMDEPGREAAVECARLLTPGKAYIANLSAKDPCELLEQGRADEIVRAAWDAKPWRPDGILNWDEVKAAIKRHKAPPIASFPWPELDCATRGIREGEIVLLVAGIGAGKSTVCRSITNHLIDQDIKIGVLPLEEPVAQFALGLVGLRLGWNTSQLEQASEDPEFWVEFEKLKGKVEFYDDQGTRDDKSLFDRIRYMALGLGCKIVVLDHLTVVIGSSAESDDRRQADRMMSELEALVKRTGVTVLVVMHLRKVGMGKSHEEGKAISMADVRGSGLIPALSHTIFAYERDQQSKRPDLGQIRLLKCRWTGRTGPAGRVQYQEDTGRLVPYDEVLEVMTSEQVQEEESARF